MFQRKPQISESRTDAEMRQEGAVLLKNALKAYSISVDSIDHYLADEKQIADKNWGCYMLQQTVELLFKGLIKYYCEDFREGHFVLYNVQMLQNMAAKQKELREISDILNQFDKRLSKVIYKWQSLARYKNLWAKTSDIELVSDLSNSLCQFIRRHDYLNAE